VVPHETITTPSGIKTCCAFSIPVNLPHQVGNLMRCLHDRLKGKTS
jgi:hypothetical protein